MFVYLSDGKTYPFILFRAEEVYWYQVLIHCYHNVQKTSIIRRLGKFLFIIFFIEDGLFITRASDTS